MTLTKKEQGLLKDLQNEEKLCVEKYRKAAENACDAKLQHIFEKIEKAEQSHYDTVTVHAVRRAGDVRGQKIAVLGAGPIGILLAQSAKALGAAQVLITDISTPRLELAKACGVDFAVNTKEHGFGEALAECFGPDKADVIYDCAGNDTTMGQAIRHARKGSTIILVAVYAGMANVDLAVLNDHELDLNTSMMYRHEDYLEAIRLVNEGKVRLEPLMSRHFPFRDYLAAYQYIDANRETTMKVLIDVDESEA